MTKRRRSGVSGVLLFAMWSCAPHSSAIGEGSALEAKVVSHFVGKDLETVQLDLVGEACADRGYYNQPTIVVDLGPGRARAHATVRPDYTGDGHRAVLVARPRELAGQSISGDLYAPLGCQDTAMHQRFTAPATSAAPSDDKLPAAWATELADHFAAEGGWRRSDAWHGFAATRVRQLAGDTGKNRMTANGPMPDELARLMETTTGIDALQEALQSDRSLLDPGAAGKPSIDVTTLPGPAVTPHPWAEMQKALAGAAPREALAAETPAEFYYVRFASVTGLFRMMDQADAWATPILSLLDGRAEDRGIAARYQTQLGVQRSELARAFGDKVIAELAVAGSDPYFGEGTDVTLLFRVKSKTLFDSTLASALASYGAAHGGITATTTDFHGTPIELAQSADRAVHRYRAQLGDLELVSNSLAAIQRVIDTHAGRHPNLASEPDFHYALARDASVPADMLAFFGDRFVAAVVGPVQKIQEARRQIALAELSTPAFASLLYGYIHGRSPRSVDELISSGLLAKTELAHHDGVPIEWTPGAAPTSTWGTPAAMTPLIDGPPLALVTTTERDAYARFVRTYESYWKRYIDPIAIRVAISKSSLALDMRVLPLIDDSEYRSLERIVGNEHVTVGPVGTGARIVTGLGEEAVNEAWHDLRYLMRDVPNLKWLGTWAAIGVEDRTQIAAALAAAGEAPEKPDHNRRRSADWSILDRLPVYGELGIRNMTEAALFIVSLRKFAEEAVPNVLTWGEAAKVQDVSIVKVTAKQEREGGLSIYYAFVKDTFVISLEEHTIRRQVESLLAGTGPQGVPEGATSGAQIVFDAAGADHGPLWTVASWVLDDSARKAGERSAVTAAALVDGAPEVAGDPAAARALAIKIFGAAPVTADGRAYERGPEGVRDPLRGDPFAPAWPSLPVAGSPVANLLAAVAGARCEIGFDTEPGSVSAAPKDVQKSLHLKLVLGMR